METKNQGESPDPENETPEQKAGKVEKQFNNKLAQLRNILAGKPDLKPRRIGGDVLSEVIEKFFEEEDKKLQAVVMEKLGKLLDGHAALHTEITKQQRALVEAKTAKMKEFNKAADELFAVIDNSKKKKESYAKSLGAALETDSKDLGDEPIVTE